MTRQGQNDRLVALVQRVPSTLHLELHQADAVRETMASPSGQTRL